MLKSIPLCMLILALSASPSFAGKIKASVAVTPAPPNIAATATFSEPSGNNILDAEETGRLVVAITNTGKGDAFDVKIEIHTDKRLPGLKFDSLIRVGTIPAGGKAFKEIVLAAEGEIATSNMQFTVSAKEANGFDADPIVIAIGTKAFVPPKLVVADFGIDDQNGNGRVEPMENVELTTRIQNLGQGDARGVVVDIVNGKHVFIGGEGITHFTLGQLRAGEYKDVKVIFYTNKQIASGAKIPLEVKITEARPQFGAAKSLDLAMNSQQRRSQDLAAKGVELPKVDLTLDLD